MSAQKETQLLLRGAETTTAYIHLRPDGIIHLAFKENVTVDMNEQEENRRTFLEITGGIKHPFLYTAGEGLVITREARENARLKEPVTPILARAIVTDNIAYRLLANFYDKFYRPIIPLKIFRSIDPAVAWLHSIPKK